MIEHGWTIFCERTIVDRETNLVSLLNILDQLRMEGPPLPKGENAVLPVNFEIVTLWQRQDKAKPERGVMKMSVHDSDGKLVGKPHELDLDLSGNPRFRTTVKVNGLACTGPGDYQVRIEFREDGVADWRLATTAILQILHDQKAD